MNSKLQQLFDALEEDRKNLLSRIRNLSPEQLRHAPEGKWSVHQILAHLIAAEKISIVYLNKKILAIKGLGDTGPWEEMKMILLQISQRLPLKFKAPKVVVENTPVYSTFEELVRDWDRTRVDLKVLLEKFDDTQIRKKIYRHVRAGKLNVQHALMFLREHIIHHTPQITRLLNTKPS